MPILTGTAHRCHLSTNCKPASFSRPVLPHPRHSHEGDRLRMHSMVGVVEQFFNTAHRAVVVLGPSL